MKEIKEDMDRNLLWKFHLSHVWQCMNMGLSSEPAISINGVYVFINPKGENMFLIVVFIYIIFIANKNEYFIHLLISYFFL